MARQKQLAVSLSDDLRALLEAESAANAHSIAEEIRQRLERTFREDQRVPELRVLLDDIEALEHLVGEDTGFAWYRSPFAFEVLKAGVVALLDQRKPKGSPAVSEAVRDLFGISAISGSDDPDTIGRALVRHINRLKLEIIDERRRRGVKDADDE